MNDRRLKRMERQHARNKKVPFNVVSLMDIFTILVFFLLVNTNEITPLPNPKGIEMPESISEVSPKESVVISDCDDVRLSPNRWLLEFSQINAELATNFCIVVDIA